MALKKYGVLKGTVSGHLRDADDDHYQILVTAGSSVHRVAVNVKSSAPNAPSTLLFIALTRLPDAFVARLATVAVGYSKLPSRPNGIALDYVRNRWFEPRSMKEVPPDAPGVDNDLKDKVEDAVLRAMRQQGSIVYAFGEKWGPEKNRKDQYFKFVPGNGIHDIHMNQGNSGKYKKDNGVYQDGGIVFQYPDGRLTAFFFAFQSQTFATDDNGNPAKAPAGAMKRTRSPITAAPSARRPRASKKARRRTSRA